MICSFLRLGFAVLLLFFLAGKGLFWLFPMKSQKFTFLERLPIYFSLGLSGIMFIAIVAHFLKVPFIPFAIFVLGGSLLLGIIPAFVRPRVEEKSEQPEPPYFRISIFLLAIVCFLLAYGGGFWLSHTADAFDHIKAVKEILDSRTIFPFDIFHYQLGRSTLAMDPTYGIWHTILALLSFYSGLDIVQIIPAVSGACAFLLVISFTAMVLKFVRRAVVSLGLVFAFFAIFFRFQFPTVFYPNQVSYILLWSLVGLFAVYLRKPEKYLSWVLAFMALGLSSLHLAFGELWLLILFFFLLFLAIFSKGPMRELRSSLQAVLRVGLMTCAWILPLIIYRTAPSILFPIQADQVFERRTITGLKMGDFWLLLKDSVSLNRPFSFVAFFLPFFPGRFRANHILLAAVGFMPLILLLLGIALYAIFPRFPAFGAYHYLRIAALMPFAPFLIWGWLVDTTLDRWTPQPSCLEP